MVNAVRPQISGPEDGRRGQWLPPQTAGAPLSWSRALLRMQELVGRAGTDLQCVMDIVVTSALEIMPHASGAVVELRDGNELVYRAASGTADSQIGRRLLLDGSFSGRCIRQGQPLRCDDSEIDDRVDRVASRAVGL